MRKNYIMQFFDIKNSSDNWNNIDLNNCKTIFFKFVSPKGLKKIFSQKILIDNVKPSTLPIEKKVLCMDLSRAPNYSAKLVELTDQFDTIGGKELKGELSTLEDIEIIHKYELAGSEGNPERITKRLLRYFETGINWDDSKEFLFKDAPHPPPSN